MVVSVQDLDCLDLIIWLRTGESAALRLGYTQPSVSRTVNRISDIFGVTLQKNGGEWNLLGDTTLLNLQRRVHQYYRWSKSSPLRLEAQYYSGPLFCDPVPAGWVAGNFDYLEINTPLRHLRDGVIDAWIGCFPDIPEEDDPDFACFHLTRLPTHLVVSERHPLAQVESQLSLEDVRAYPSLALPDGAFPKIQAILQKLGLWNLPVDRFRYSREQWEGRVESDFVIGYASAFSISLFEAPQVILPVPIPMDVGDSLVVKREFAEHPRFIELLQQLQQKAQELQQRFPEVVIPAV